MLNRDRYGHQAMLGGHIVKVAFDPRAAYGANSEKLLAACGVIPSIFSEAAMGPDTEDAPSMYKRAVEVYSFGDYSSVQWGTVTPEGVYVSSHDEDPDLNPMVVFYWPFGVEVLVYPHAIIAVRDEENTIISRMD